LGINVDFRIVELAILLQHRVNGDFMMAMDGLSLPWGDPDAYYQYFHSSGYAYATGVKFKNELLDQLLEEGRRTLEVAKRKTTYADVERILAMEAPWIFALWRPQGEVGRSNIKGYVRLPGSLGSGTVAFLERLWIENSR
jgi:peptide/nickel transport system substrate-binding protein